MPTTRTPDRSEWSDERIDRLAKTLLPLVFDASVVRLPQPQPSRRPAGCCNTSQRNW
jgi:hypothetical protein